MPSFLVEIYAPELARVGLPELMADAQAAVDRVTLEGSPVRLLHAIFVPEDETCYLAFEGASEQAVRHAARLAGLLSESRHSTVKQTTNLKGEYP